LERGLFRTAQKAFMEAQILNVAIHLCMQLPISMKHSIMTRKTIITKIIITMGLSPLDTFMKDQFALIHWIQTFCVQ